LALFYGSTLRHLNPRFLPECKNVRFLRFFDQKGVLSAQIRKNHGKKQINPGDASALFHPLPLTTSPFAVKVRLKSSDEKKPPLAGGFR
jgi:hypothetical protein